MGYIDPDGKADRYRRQRASQQQKRDRHDAKRPKLPKGRPPIEDRRVFVHIRMRSSVLARTQRMMNEAVALKKYAWKSQSDMYEDLVIKGMSVYADQGDETAEEAMEYLRAVEPARIMAAHRTEAMAAYARTKQEINELLEAKAEGAAIGLFHIAMRSFYAMTNTVWRTWLVDQMERTFPKLAKSKPPKPSIDEDLSGEHYADAPTRKAKPRIEEE